jgi:hypothetical protein
MTQLSKWLQSWWQILIGLATMLVLLGMAWSGTQQEIAGHETRIEGLEKKVEADHDILLEMRSDIKWLIRKEN